MHNPGLRGAGGFKIKKKQNIYLEALIRSLETILKITFMFGT